MGVVFTLVGVAGFIPGLTTDLDELAWAGIDSEAMLLGVFQVSVLHNIVHLAFGVLGIVAARTIENAGVYLVAGGLVYLVLFLFGLFVDQDSDTNFVPVNEADDWLHLGLALGMLGLAGALWPRDRRQHVG